MLKRRLHIGAIRFPLHSLIWLAQVFWLAQPMGLGIATWVYRAHMPPALVAVALLLCPLITLYLLLDSWRMLRRTAFGVRVTASGLALRCPLATHVRDFDSLDSIRWVQDGRPQALRFCLESAGNSPVLIGTTYFPAPVVRDLYQHILEHSDAVELEPMIETRLWTRVENTVDEFERTASFDLRGISKQQRRTARERRDAGAADAFTNYENVFRYSLPAAISFYAFIGLGGVFCAAMIVLWAHQIVIGPTTWHISTMVIAPVFCPVGLGAIARLLWGQLANPHIVAWNDDEATIAFKSVRMAWVQPCSDVRAAEFGDTNPRGDQNMEVVHLTLESGATHSFTSGAFGHDMPGQLFAFVAQNISPDLDHEGGASTTQE